MTSIRKAELKDIDAVEQIYNDIHDSEENGAQTIGWIRGVYPIRKTAEDAFERGDFFVQEDQGQIVSAGIINQIQVDVYALGEWEYDVKDEEVSVLHTLVISPKESGNGYGKAFIAFYENYAREHGCWAIKRSGLYRPCLMGFRMCSLCCWKSIWDKYSNEERDKKSNARQMRIWRACFLI